MRAIGLTTSPQVEVISAYAVSNQQIDAVASDPAWFIIGAFHLPASADVQLDVIGVVSIAGRTLRVRLFDLDAAAPVSGSTVDITETVDTRKLSGVVALVGGHVYQMQAEVIGGVTGFGIVKTATLV